MTPIMLTATLGQSLDQTFAAFDYGVFAFFGSIQNGFLTVLAKIFTSLGDEAFVIPMALLGVLLCCFRRTRKLGLSVVFAVAIGTVVTNLAVKPLALRIRPYNTLQADPDYWRWYVGAGMLSESDYSFPSGHVTAAFEIGTAVFLCLMKKGRRGVAWIFPVLGVLVAASRVYLMVHYATDVLAGFLVGSLAGACGYVLADLAVGFLEKRGLDDRIDAERLFKKKLPSALGVGLVLAAVVAVWGVSFGMLLTEGGEEALRCAYHGEYHCQNEARVGDKYPPIDGKYYCKIHWKELSEGTAPLPKD